MKYTNPIIKGFHPDPSICRVGKDYYLVTSTFEYFPGIPVYHSTDLINWEMIGHCIDRVDQLDLNLAKASGGIWAPTIRYHKGIFYVTATFSEKGNFIVSSKSPASGYSNPVWVEMDGIDPSMFFEDGRMYYCANDCGSRGEHGEGISVAEMDPDTGKVIGEIKRVWQGTGGGWLEAPHIYHIGEYYYLLAAEGGTSWGHMVTEARSKNIWGPYESYAGNPILTNKHDTSKEIACSGHADLVDDIEGNYWLVHLGIRSIVYGKSNLGRETFLMPANLKNDWICVEGGKAKIEVEKIGDHVSVNAKNIKMDFSATEWEKEWLFIGNPSDTNYQRDSGKLILKPSEGKLTDHRGEKTFVGIRQPDFDCRISTEIEFIPMKHGDEAGLIVYLTPDFNYRICKRREDDEDYVIVEKRADDFYQIAYKEKITADTITFSVKADKEKYHFSYRMDGNTVNAVSASTKFMCTDVAGRCFTGVLIGVYAQCETEALSKAVVKNFEVGF